MKAQAPNPKERVKATSQGIDSNLYNIIFQDESQKSRYDALIKRKVVNTQYFDDKVLDILGLKDDVYWMLYRIGWVPFMKTKCPTYIQPTLEFLNSIEANV